MKYAVWATSEEGDIHYHVASVENADDLPARIPRDDALVVEADTNGAALDLFVERCHAGAAEEE